MISNDHMLPRLMEMFREGWRGDKVHEIIEISSGPRRLEEDHKEKTVD
jgi:hypothetical protein